jgi:hypothetical protein
MEIFTLVKWLSSRKQKGTNVTEDAGKKELLHTDDGNENYSS